MSFWYKILLAGILSIAVGVLLSLLSNKFNDTGDSVYFQQLEKQRAAKDQYFRTSPDSPMPDSLKNSWLPLNYYQIDPSFRVDALVENLPQPLPYSDELEITARVTFEIHGKKCVWMGLKLKLSQNNEILLAFQDGTSGKTTYGGGRFIDISPKDAGFIIDFNTAYLPYCAFNADYVCPLPPPENKTDIMILAGERLPESVPATH